MKSLRFLPAFFLLALLSEQCTQISRGPVFKISFAPELESQAQDGRLLLMLANNNKTEPRFQITDALTTQLVFGADVEGMKPGEQVTVDATAFGYPVQNVKDIPAGEYYVQALLNRYETFTLKTGHTVKLPPDKGEGQQWNMKPDNFYSEPVKIFIDPAKGGTFEITMNKKIPPVAEPRSTKYIRHIKIQSKLLTEWWGRPMYLGAFVLVPEGFDEHPEARYPLMIYHGHFPSDFGGFSETPPDPNMDTTDYSTRFGIYGYKKIQAQEAYNFYRQWTSKRLGALYLRRLNGRMGSTGRTDFLPRHAERLFCCLPRPD